MERPTKVWDIETKVESHTAIGPAAFPGENCEYSS